MFAEIYLDRTNPHRTFCPCSSSKLMHNSCITVGSSAGHQGFEYGIFGHSNPETLNGKSLFYSFLWIEDGSSSIAKIRFGNTGTNRYGDNIDILRITNYIESFACWNEIESCYVLDDQDVIDSLISVGDNNSFCLYFNGRLVLPPFVVVQNNNTCIVNGNKVIMNRSE